MVVIDVATLDQGLAQTQVADQGQEHDQDAAEFEAPHLVDIQQPVEEQESSELDERGAAVPEKAADGPGGQ